MGRTSLHHHYTLYKVTLYTLHCGHMRVYRVVWYVKGKKDSADFISREKAEEFMKDLLKEGHSVEQMTVFESRV